MEGGGAVDLQRVLNEWSEQIAARLTSGIVSFRESSLGMAQQIALRVRKVSGAMSGKCSLVSAEDSIDMAIPKDHAEMFDTLRLRFKPYSHHTLNSRNSESSPANSRTSLPSGTALTSRTSRTSRTSYSPYRTAVGVAQRFVKASSSEQASILRNDVPMLLAEIQAAHRSGPGMHVMGKRR